MFENISDDGVKMIYDRLVAAIVRRAADDIALYYEDPKEYPMYRPEQVKRELFRSIVGLYFDNDFLEYVFDIISQRDYHIKYPRKYASQCRLKEGQNDA